MDGGARSSFALKLSLSYAVLALAWIFLSDRLLDVVDHPGDVLWLSNAKGVFFVLVSALGGYFALLAQPSGKAPMLSAALARARPRNWQRVALRYGFAVLTTGALLAMRLSFSSIVAERPFLILYMLPIILSAMLGGLGPGLLATALAGAGAMFQSWTVNHGQGRLAFFDHFQCFVMIVSGILVSVLMAKLRDARTQSESQRRLLDAVMSGTTDAIFVKDLQGRYLYANPAACAFMDLRPEAVLGRSDAELFSGQSAAVVRRLDRHAIEHLSTCTGEEELVTPDGRQLVFLVTKGPVFDADAQGCGIFGISRDITGRKQIEEQLRLSEERLQMVVEATSDGLWDWDLASGRWYQTAGAEALTGTCAAAPSRDYPGFAASVHPADLAAVLQHIQAHREGHAPGINADFRTQDENGATRWVKVVGRAVERDAAGLALRLVGTLSDITAGKLAELAQCEAATVFASSHEGIMMVSPEGLISKVNPAFEKITGFVGDEVVGRSPNLLASGRHQPEFYRQMWQDIRGEGFWRGEIWNRRKCGEVYAELLTICAVRDKQGVLQHYLAMFSDISQLKAHEEELNQIANFDPLTGTPNRRLLSDRFAQALARAARSGGTLAICFLDLDGFKAVNDSYGHRAGDQLLIGVARHLSGVLRADDTLARLGGDEFVLLLSDVGGPAACAEVLERVLAAVSAPVQVDGGEVRVTASVGVSLYPQDKVDADSLLRHADQAMYLAKQGGKNRYHLFDPENDRKAHERRCAIDRMRLALLNREFELYYQPKVDLRDGEVVGAEGLIRWRHPERGLLAPAVFLPDLYGSELEQEVGDWVIETALAQMALWQRQGMRVAVSVNVSADQLLDARFPARLELALKRHADLRADQLELEVLETAAISDIAQASAVLERCRALGVHFSLDDFGTGYSSLTYLRKLPVDTLKIDQSFVRHMLADPEDMRIICGVVQLAQAFGRKVVAEGVETLEHGAVLLQMGCWLAQGYGVARPMPAGEFGAWQARWRAEGAWRALGGVQRGGVDAVLAPADPSGESEPTVELVNGDCSLA